MLTPSWFHWPAERPRVGLSGSVGLLTNGPGDWVGTTLPPLVPGVCSAGPPGEPSRMLGSLPYNMSDMQLPTVGPLCALPAAKAGALKQSDATLSAKSAFLIFLSPRFSGPGSLMQAAVGRRRTYRPIFVLSMAWMVQAILASLET